MLKIILRLWQIWQIVVLSTNHTLKIDKKQVPDDESVVVLEDEVRVVEEIAKALDEEAVVVVKVILEVLIKDKVLIAVVVVDTEVEAGEVQEETMIRLIVELMMTMMIMIVIWNMTIHGINEMINLDH